MRLPVSAAMLLILVTGCDDRPQASSLSDPQPTAAAPLATPRGPNDPGTAAVTVAPEPPSAAGDPEADGRFFADGRFTIELPWRMRFEEQAGAFRSERDRDAEGVTSIAYQDLGAHAEVAGTAELYAAAERAIGEGTRLSPGRLDHWIAQRAQRRDGGVHHAVVAWLADETVVVLQGRGDASVADEIEAVAHSFRVVRPSGGADESRTPVGEDDIGTSPTATAAEAARVPRSDRPGRPSFGGSCNSIGSSGSCDEVEPGLLDQLNCGALGIRSEELPCPNQGRLTTCLMLDGRRARHYYDRSTDAALICERVGGEFHEDRVFPRRPAQP